MKKEDIYLRSPEFVQRMIINLQGQMISRTRYNEQFHAFFRHYCDSEPTQPDLQRLKKFLLAASLTPFWNKRFLDYGVDISNNDPVSEIMKLPVLTKPEVKAHFAEIANTKIDAKFTYSHTSGTTGSGLVFPETIEMQNRQWAVWWRYRSWYGLNFDTWMGWFGGRTIVNIDRHKPPFWRSIPPLKQVMFSAHHLNGQTVGYYLDEIMEKKLTWLHGYPSQLSLFANLIREKKINFSSSIRYITVGAENLLARQKSIIEEVFGVPVRQHYGLAEGTANISEHPDGELVPDLDFALTELIPCSAEENTTCKIIGTNYNNPAFPLIRYDSDDIAEVEWLADGKCRIRAIDGREEDYIVLPNGVKLGRLDHIFKDFTQIQECQIYQPDIRTIILKVVKTDQYHPEDDEPLLIHEIHKRMGKEILIVISYIDKIPRLKSGKFRFVISDVKN